MSMIALMLLAFCCCPGIAAEPDTHAATVQSDQDELKEKIKTGCEKFKEGKYTLDITMNTGSAVHHTVETLSYNNLSGEFEVTREVDTYIGENTSLPYYDQGVSGSLKMRYWEKAAQTKIWSGKNRLGYATLFDKFTAIWGAKYRGSPASSIDAPVYIRLG